MPGRDPPPTCPEHEGESDALNCPGAVLVATGQPTHARAQCAANIAMIGEYYKIRARNTLATYAGIPCALLGTAAIIAAYTLLPT